ncbi:hypothetical protein N8I77_011534 [Diaporthe amygdali]|uniref:F-box domain-containing protein n=1 Tax=Phomopsis amygdali TaxID=1214568 RepID=A0AAD9VYQ7_PHOAM|nr:hypothetical protein N8I77_011534 [Diaporthe amygdali]
MALGPCTEAVKFSGRDNDETASDEADDHGGPSFVQYSAGKMPDDLEELKGNVNNPAPVTQNGTALQTERLLPRGQECDKKAIITNLALGSSTILGLPTELLLRIFRWLSKRETWSDPNEIKLPNEDIKNVRLSCKHFGEVASEFLIDHVRIYVSERSLAHFEEICRHPRISRCVRAVEVCLAQYDIAMANDLALFTGDFIYELERQQSGTPEEIYKAQAIANTWRRALKAYESGHYITWDNFGIEESGYIKALEEGYDGYCHNYEKQQILLQEGSFTGRLAAAMAELQQAKHLEQEQLSLTLKELRSFRFEHRGITALTPEAFRALSCFLNACLKSNKLACLVINAGHWSEHSTSLISTRSWPKLRHVVLERFGITERDLDLLTEASPSWTEGQLVLDEIRLISGTWAGVLDVLRQRRIRLSLGYSGGAECDTRGHTWACDIFCKRHDGHGPSLAELYVWGEDMPNPIQPL